MTLHQFKRAFLALHNLGDAIIEQGFSPDADCNVNALREFRDWLERYAPLFDDASYHIASLNDYIQQST